MSACAKPRLRTIETCDGRPSLFYVLHIAKENKWMKFWDVALEHGYDGTKSSMSILKLLCLTVFSDRNCPMHDCPYIVPQDMPLCEHFMECHTDFDSSTSPDFITNCISSCTSDPEHFMGLMVLTSLMLHYFSFRLRVFHSSLYGVNNNNFEL